MKGAFSLPCPTQKVWVRIYIGCQPLNSPFDYLERNIILILNVEHIQPPEIITMLCGTESPEGCGDDAQYHSERLKCQCYRHDNVL